jgi:hypothetical protein
MSTEQFSLDREMLSKASLWGGPPGPRRTPWSAAGPVARHPIG